MLRNQVESGKAWEYGLAKAFADICAIPLLNNSPRNTAQKAYNCLTQEQRNRIDRAANEAVVFLRAHDARLDKTTQVSLQSDMQGRHGDVRDIVIATNDGDVGISSKHRHKAVKHSRLSPNIDFGNQWYGVPCSSAFCQSVKPIWDTLQAYKLEGALWRNIEDKSGTVYQPIVSAFCKEIGNAPAEKLLRYMLGVYDFYKVEKENGDVLLQSFNMDGILKWGNKLPMPKKILNVAHSKQSTCIITFDNGWSLSFRIHNAESRVVPSLKFDVNLVGVPPKQVSHTIEYAH